ncbi:hypothetical protein Tco_1493173 [Tanacetum coccineum]
MTTPVEKRNANKFCEFHGEVGHNTDECMHMRKQIEEMLKAEKLSHLVKEIKQNNGNEQPIVTKKGETTGKDKAMAIIMVQPWKRVARQRITQSFSPNSEISFPSMGEDEGTEGPMIIEAKIGGHCVHRIRRPQQVVQPASTKLRCFFAWKLADMTGVPRHIAEHRLNVRKGCSPVRQKKKGQAADRN